MTSDPSESASPEGTARSITLASQDFETTGPTRIWQRSVSSVPVRAGRPKATSLTPASTVAGRFRVGRRIAQGGMGEVWDGEHLATQMKVAIKALLPCSLASDDVSNRFVREARLLARLRSEHVARVVDFIDETEFGPLLVMEFIEGESLADVLARRRLSVEQAVELGAEIARALCELHRARIVHRDVKPQNVILHPMGNGRQRAVIIDLGVSRALGEDPEAPLSEVTLEEMGVGTMEYMPPEQFLGARDVTEAADQYALGALLFRATTGRHLFGDLEGVALARAKLTRQPVVRLESARQDRVGRGLETILQKALRADPAERYASMTDLLAALEALDRTASTRRYSIAPRPPRRFWARRLLPLAAAAMLGALAALSLEPRLGAAPPVAKIHEARADSRTAQAHNPVISVNSMH